jgi:hypothetical protein
VVSPGWVTAKMAFFQGISTPFCHISCRSQWDAGIELEDSTLYGPASGLSNLLRPGLCASDAVYGLIANTLPPKLKFVPRYLVVP